MNKVFIYQVILYNTPGGMISFLFSPSHMPTCRMQWVYFVANPAHAFLSHQPPAPHFARCVLI